MRGKRRKLKKKGNDDLLSMSNLKVNIDEYMNKFYLDI